MKTYEFSKTQKLNEIFDVNAWYVVWHLKNLESTPTRLKQKFEFHSQITWFRYVDFCKLDL